MPTTLPFVPSVGAYEFNFNLPGGAKDAQPNAVVFRAYWNANKYGGWYFDLSEENGSQIATGVKIVLGINLCQTSQHIVFESVVLRAVDTTRQGRDATFDDMGTRVLVQVWTREELEADPDDRTGELPE